MRIFELKSMFGKASRQTPRGPHATLHSSLFTLHSARGFTLIEMLVVIGIIAILIGALMVGFGRVTKSAQRARAQETVQNVATALALLEQNLGSWPKVLLQQMNDGSGKGMNVAAAQVMAKYDAKFRLMGLTYTKTGSGSAATDYTLKGIDRCGIVDPWAAAVLKRNENANEASAVPSGGTVRDHMIFFAVDEDGDGIVEAQVNGTPVRIRASAVAWCAGADGKLADYAKVGRSDDIYSWRKDQEADK